MVDKLTPKRVAVIPFPGGWLEVRNAHDYPERRQDPATGEWKDTGNMRKGNPGTFLCLPNSNPVNVSGLPLDEVFSSAVVKRFKDNTLAAKILKENEQAALN